MVAKIGADRRGDKVIVTSEGITDVKRLRICFDADPDVWQIVQGKAKGARGQYLNELVRRLDNPPYRLVVPHPLEMVSAESLLEGAQTEIILLGISLRGLIDHHRELLTSKIASRVPTTIVIINPDVEKGDPVYSMLLKRLVKPQFVDEVLRQVGTSATFFRELRELGFAHSTLVRVLACNEVPMCGMVVVDHNQTTAKMRVNIYSNLSVGAKHPYLDINPMLDEGRVTYNVFYDYFEKLVRRTMEIA